MSGPKVVRIVTRDELIGICKGHLARVDAALAEWTRVGKRNDALSEAEIARVSERREHLGRLLDADQFMEVQKQAPDMVAFLQNDQRQRATEAAQKAAKARSAGRRRADAAQALLSALQKSGKLADQDLRRSLERAAAGSDDPAALQRAFSLLSAPLEKNRQATWELAAKHKAGESSQSFAEWVRTQSDPQADAGLDRLDARLAEMAAIVGDAAGKFEKRLADARNEHEPKRRALLIDSLDMDLGRELTVTREREQARGALALVLAELGTLDPKAAEAFSVDVATANAAELSKLETDARLRIEVLRNDRAAAARREAVLGSLAAMGYEVTEGMSTSWVKDGHVVLRKPAQPGYGVEISGNPQTAKLQLRAVAFTDGLEGPDPSKDRDAETIWCGDVGQLEAKLAAAGGGMVIEKALPIGATPLKRVVDPALAQRRAEGGRGRQSRTLT